MNSNYYDSNIQPYQIRFENSLKEPIISKCRLLTDLINESLSSNVKEIQQRYVLLIEDIFAFNFTNIAYPRTDWKLKTVTFEASPHEFNAILDFLSSTGTLLKLIRHLMNDNSIRYEFPIACLPSPTRAAFTDGLIPNLYTNKISQSFSNAVSLNAFEYYIFHFAYFITYHQSTKCSPANIDWSSGDNCNSIYYALLENYLEAFIPIPSSGPTDANENSKSLNECQSLWKSLSSLSTTTSNILNLASPKHELQPKNNSGLNLLSTSNAPNQSSLLQNTSAMSPLLQKSSLMSSKIFSLNKFQQNQTPNLDSHDHDILGTPVYKCETVLNVLTEFWLNHVSAHNVEDSSRNVKNLSNGNFHFTVEHMRAIRILVKHLHYFANSNRKRNCDFHNSSLHTQYNSGGIVTAETNDPLDDLRRNLWSPKYLIQKKLYHFLKLAFDRWPNDSSFRVPLETWLSYIQPWRYISKSKTTRKQSDEQNDSQNSTGSDIPEWKRFIMENLFFYTIIFRQVIDRISKILDLNSSSSALLLFRMTKVFAQRFLCASIKEAELNLLNGSDLAFNFRLNNSTNLLSPSIKQISSNNMAAPIKHALMEMEPISNMEYASFFSPSFRDQIISLLMKIAKYLNVTESTDQKKKNAASSNSTSETFLTSVVSFFSFETPNSNLSSAANGESAKTKNYLEQSVSFLSLIFEIQQQSIETIMSSDKGFDADSVDSVTREQNAYEVVNGVPKLSEHGRNLILSGSLKNGNVSTPHLIEGNPDTQPVRTFEVELLVKLALFLSLLINTRYESFFMKYYNEDSLFGAFLKQILSPPLKYVCYVKTNNRMASNMIVKELPPRVDLRFIASKGFLIYLIFFLLFCRLLNFSILNISFLLFTIFISYIATKAMLTSFKK